MNIAIAATPQRKQALAKTKLFLENYGLIIALLLVISGMVMAGGQGAEFDQIYQMIRGWIEGTLGKLIAVGTFVVGIGIGIVKQSVMAIVVAIGVAIVCAYAPAVLDAVFTFAL